MDFYTSDAGDENDYPERVAQSAQVPGTSGKEGFENATASSLPFDAGIESIICGRDPGDENDYTART